MTSGGTVVRGGTRHLWLAFATIGLVGSWVVWVVMPHDWVMANVWEPLFKVAVFVCLCLATALAPNAFRYRYLVTVVPFLLFLGYILPRVSFFVFYDVPAESQLAREGYTVLYLLLYPGIVLSVALAYRMGGGSSGGVLKVCLSGVVLIFSGFLDVMWPLANGKPLPDVIQAHHIKIIIGHFPSYSEAVLFCLAHIPVLVAVNLLPLDRWLSRLTGIGGPHDPSPPTPDRATVDPSG
jgi:hypothetical protein